MKLLHIRKAAMTALFSLNILCSTPAHGVPAYPGLIPMQQPDGTWVNVRIHGDENFHYYTTADNKLLVEVDGSLYYALPGVDGRLIRSAEQAQDIEARTPQIVTLLASLDQKDLLTQYRKQKMSQRAKRTPYAERAARMSDTQSPMLGQSNSGMTAPSNPVPGLFTQENPFPTKGKQKVLVILVQFSDTRFVTPSAHEYFSSMLNQHGWNTAGATGSAFDYYHTASSGQFEPQFDVYGPVTLGGNAAYYGGNDAYGNDLYPREMVVEAASLLDKDVDFSQYDNNNDGYVDNIFIYYAGRGEATGGGANTIWPHSWNIGSLSPVLDGVKLDSYACSNEIVINSTTRELETDAIGTFCHEFGHVLGLPDLYSTSYIADNTPGIWSLMASGSYTNNSRTPPTLSGWERAALGWLTPTVIWETGTYPLPVSLISTNQAYLIPTAKANEFFFLENRQFDMGDWDHYLPSAGMLVWHIDYDKSAWDYNILNDDPNHQRVDVVEAHGKDNLGLPPLTCFPSGSYTSLTNTTHPALKSWDGSPTDIILPLIEEDEDNYDITLHAVSTSGVKQIRVADNMTVTCKGLEITIHGAEGVVSIYDMSGREVTRFNGDATVTLPSNGVYLLRCGTNVSKVIL